MSPSDSKIVQVIDPSLEVFSPGNLEGFLLGKHLFIGLHT